MSGKIQKWGNSLAIRIPKTYAEALELSEGASIKMKIMKDKLVISRRKKQDIKLNELLSGINEKNTHKEVVYQKPVLKEAN